MKNFNRYLSALATLTMAFTILTYDGMTNLRARIKAGTVEPQVRKQYTSTYDKTFYHLGYEANMRILNTKYVPGYDCAVNFDPASCKAPLKQRGQ